MPANPIAIELDPLLFGERQRLIASSGSFRVTAFRYRSGVCGLRIENGAGTVTFLPFQGQQIWDAHFLGRRLTMRSMFEEPRPTRDYLRTYGAFFVHCGGTAMGNPGPDDTHPLHGELPNLPYDTAELVFGHDGAGAFLELAGTANETLAFHHNFVARPRVRLYEGATAFEASIDVENRAGGPLPFLYLGHVNFRPADGGVLIDAMPDDRTGVVIRQPVLHQDTSAAVRDYHRAIAANPASHRNLSAGVPIEPELVMTMQLPAGADGWAHAMQRHPGGSADFVSYRPSELPFAVRWIKRGPDEDALGVVLPATAAPDGLAAAVANRQLVWVAPGRSFHADMRFGALDAASAQKLELTLSSTRAGGVGLPTP